MTERSFGERVRPWIPALLWVGVIACESTGLFSAENTGRWLWQIVTRLFGAVNRQEFQLAHSILRKVGHFVGYGVLSYFFYVGWRGRYLSQLRLARKELGRATGRAWRGRWAALAIGMTFVVAALDEFHQLFLPNRTGLFRDVLLDTLGGVAAVTMVYFFNHPRCIAEPVREKEHVV